MGMTFVIPLAVIEAGGHNAFEAGLVLFPRALTAHGSAGMITSRQIEASLATWRFIRAG